MSLSYVERKMFFREVSGNSSSQKLEKNKRYNVFVWNVQEKQCEVSKNGKTQVKYSMICLSNCT